MSTRDEIDPSGIFRADVSMEEILTLKEAVIVAAVARYESFQRTGEQYFEYDHDLNEAVGNLLAARAGKETG